MSGAAVFVQSWFQFLLSVQFRSVVPGFLFLSVQFQVFSALSLPYLFGFALTVNHIAATPSQLNSK